ncbi:MAG: hypothetical protein IJ584_05295 [Bacteroidales bacterium]|nr:hypothetical protein [Bacteroidales bacterium]
MRTEPVPSAEDRKEVVYYCRHCHSIYILIDDDLADDDWDGSYCGKCHSTDIGKCSFGEWYDEEERRKRTLEELEWRR